MTPLCVARTCTLSLVLARPATVKLSRPLVGPGDRRGPGEAVQAAELHRKTLGVSDVGVRGSARSLARIQQQFPPVSRSS